MTALLVFLSTLAADVCWARYVRAAGSGQWARAGAWSCGIFLTGAFAIVSYVGNHWLLIPAVAGAFVGSCVGVGARP